MDIKKYLREAGAVILILSLLGCIWLWGYAAGSSAREVCFKDSIVIKDSIIIDSIFIENTKIETKIKYFEKEYTEKVATITNNADSANYILFSDYLYDYQRSTKNN